MNDAYCLVLSTCPNSDSARSIARALIEQKFAACVNILPGLTSLYRWKGSIEEGEEVLLIVKTTRDRYPDVESCIRATHPYELPEVIAIAVETGLQDYLAWIGEQCQ